MSARPFELPASSILPEPKLLFAAGVTDVHPHRGLVRNGPYSIDLAYPVSVRLAYFSPSAVASRLDDLVREVQGEAAVREAANYYVAYPGFAQAFRCPLVPP